MGEITDLKGDIQLNKSRIQIVNMLENQVKKLRETYDGKNIKNLFDETNKLVKESISSNNVIDKLKAEEFYQEIKYSKEKTNENINSAKEKTISFLCELKENIENKEIKFENRNDFSEEYANLIISKILSNFYKHIEVMYNSTPHAKAGIKKELLDKIKIKNEYDVQRILYSIIKPIFPEARVEVSDDTVRYDIFIEEYSIVIEVKCSRGSMTERKLTEEIGSDIFHYKYKNLFFFIYDKEKIIKDIDHFNKEYNKKINEKNINTIVIQPITL